MKNQLFRNIPDLNFTLELLSFFGLSSLTDIHSFNKQNLMDLKTVDKIIQNIDRISKYYLPCKSRVYLSNLTEKKCITILRQFIKVHNYTLMYKEKYLNSKKSVYYQVIPIQIDINTEKKEDKKIVISFD
jgi:hypothetical protein